MSGLRNGVFYIENEGPATCDHCGENKEIRPYGPPGKVSICFDCKNAIPGMEEICRQNYYKILDQAESVVIMI
jgi:hypothetical protein